MFDLYFFLMIKVYVFFILKCNCGIQINLFINTYSAGMGKYIKTLNTYYDQHINSRLRAYQINIAIDLIINKIRVKK